MLMFMRSNKKTKNEVSLNDPIGADKEGNSISLIDILCTDENSVLDQVAAQDPGGKAVCKNQQSPEHTGAYGDRTQIRIVRKNLSDSARDGAAIEYLALVCLQDRKKGHREAVPANLNKNIELCPPIE